MTDENALTERGASDDRLSYSLPARLHQAQSVATTIFPFGISQLLTQRTAIGVARHNQNRSLARRTAETSGSLVTGVVHR